MEKCVWRARIAEGFLEEYKRRHDQIWPEMVAALKSAGITNYTIWADTNELFGYYECSKGIEYASKVKSESPAVQKWNEYMKDILIMEKDPITGAQSRPEMVFELD